MGYTIQGKVVVITGAASGIGALTVKSFSEEGAKYVAILDISEDGGRTLEKEINEKYSTKAKFIKCDVSQEEQIENAFKTVLKENGFIDVVINNAGIFNERMYNKTINVHLKGTIIGSQKAYELMRKDNGGKGGTIINIASIAALQTDSALPIYTAAKGAIIQFSICLGKEPNYSRSDVRVISICFGGTNTPILSFSKDICLYDECYQDVLDNKEACRIQSVESAVNSLVHAFKNGASASTWLSVYDEPPQDITPRLTKFYDILMGVDE